MHRHFGYLILIISGLSSEVQSQVIPSERFVDWENVGASISSEDPDHTVNFADLGADLSGNTSNSTLLESILDSLSDESLKIYFPKGDYLFEEGINLSSKLIFKGDGADHTNFLFNLNGSGNLFNAQGSISTDTIHLKYDVLKGDRMLILETIEEFRSGQLLKIIDDDIENITSSWAHYSTGQIIEVNYQSQDTLFLQNEIRRDFEKSRRLSLFLITPIFDILINDISVERLDSTIAQTSNFRFNFTRDIEISCIESTKCNFAHIDLRNSYHISILKSSFSDGFDYGGGGKAYGAMLHFSTSECLIEENIFNHLRHSMILQAGANGNVFGYNYSVNPFWTGVVLPSDAAGDMVLHGNYPYANLFEANVGQNIVIDNSHGLNGKLNTFFRNRANNYGVFMNTNPASSGQNFVGNEVTSFELFKGLYILTGNDHFEYGNNVKEEILPLGTDDLIDSTYYGAIPSEFYMDLSSWPPVGIPAELNQYENISEYVSRLELSLCADFVVSSNLLTEDHQIGLKIYPNPCETILNIELVDTNQDITEVLVFDNSGRLVLRQIQPDVSNLLPGFYWIKVLSSEKQFLHARFVKD